MAASGNRRDGSYCGRFHRLRSSASSEEELGEMRRIEKKLLAKLARDHALDLVHAEVARGGPEAGREGMRSRILCGVCTRQRRVRSTTRALFPEAAQFRVQAFFSGACSWLGGVGVQIRIHSLLKLLLETTRRRYASGRTASASRHEAERRANKRLITCERRDKTQGSNPPDGVRR